MDCRPGSRWSDPGPSGDARRYVLAPTDPAHLDGQIPRHRRRIAALPAKNAYLDGELCGVLPDGKTAFNLIQNASDTGQGSLVFFLFDLLFVDGEDITALPLVDRKGRLKTLLKGAPTALQYNDHQIGHGPAFHRLACEHGLEGIVSKRISGRYEPDRRSWLKTKCLNREEFVVAGHPHLIIAGVDYLEERMTRSQRSRPSH